MNKLFVFVVLILLMFLVGFWFVNKPVETVESLPINTTTPTYPPVMCTPPLCRNGEVYFCEGVCPGGCGTRCVTPTPKI